MPDTDTAAPPTLLALYALSHLDGWQSVADIRADIAATTDSPPPARSTLSDALVELRVRDRVEHRRTVRNGSETLLYRVRDSDTSEC